MADSTKQTFLNDLTETFLHTSHSWPWPLVIDRTKSCLPLHSHLFHLLPHLPSHFLKFLSPLPCSLLKSTIMSFRDAPGRDNSRRTTVAPALHLSPSDSFITMHTGR